MTLSFHEMLGKLSPIMPEKSKAWRNGFENGSLSTRHLIERHVRLQFEKTFPTGALLLRPPPPNLFKGKFDLGSVMYSKPWGSFGLTSNELLQNLVILGRSGAGKTNVGMHLVDHLLRKDIPFLFFDWKRTCRDLLPTWQKRLKVFTPGRNVSPFHFNLLSPPKGLESAVWNRHFIDTVARAYTLGDGAKSLLQKAISAVETNPALQLNLGNLVQALAAIPAQGRMGGWKVSATRALESLLQESHQNDGNAQSFSPADLLTSATALELDALSTSYKKCLIPLLCLFLFFHQLHSAKREQLSFVIFVEEAHHLLHRQSHGASESVMEMLMRQCREVGIAMVVLDQHPHLLSPAVLGNSYCSICLNLKAPQDINHGSSLSQLSTTDRSILSRLPVGYGVVKTQDRWLTPFLVKFHHLELEKGRVRDSDLKEASALEKTSSVPRESLQGRPGPLGSSRRGLSPKDESFELLADVLAFPTDGVDNRYKRLSWSCDKGHRTKKHLVGTGLLQEEFVQDGRKRRLLLRWTPVANATLPSSRSANSAESIAHAYWKRVLAEALSEQGYEVKLEARCVLTGRVDILAKRDQLKVAVEIETGKSDCRRNVQKCLKSGFDRVVVAATTKIALSKVERQLAEAGLLIPNRVDVVLAARLAEELKRDCQSNPFSAVP